MPASLAALVVAAVGFVWPAHVRAAPPRQDAEAGKQVYDQRCWFCHGEQGDGNGPVADYLHPRPRDFTRAVFKLRTTLNATLPGDDDLVRTIKRGMPGTAMPAWEGILSDREVRDVIAHLKTFASDAWQDESIAPQPVRVGRPPRVSASLLQRGRQVYEGDAGCIECHGAEGRGDGKSAPDMTDDWDRPIRPADLTKPWRYKGGSGVADIFTRFSTGMDGSPMPSFLDAVPDEGDRWALSAYVASLQRKPSEGAVVPALRVEGEVPTAPDDERWQAAAEVVLPLSGQVVVSPRWQIPSVDSLSVRAAFNESQISFLVEWDDFFRNAEDSGRPPAIAEDETYVPAVEDYMRDHNSYEDAVALQFAVKIPDGPRRPYFLLGQPGQPVNLWRWGAASGSAQELNATGAQNEQQAQPEASQNLSAAGAWENGRWRVVMTRARTTEDTQDIQFEAGKFIPIAFQAWDGFQGETGLLMSMSSWYNLVLPIPRPASAYVYALLAVALVAAGEWWLVLRLRRGAPEQVPLSPSPKLQPGASGPAGGDGP